MGKVRDSAEGKGGVISKKLFLVFYVWSVIRPMGVSQIILRSME